MKAKRARALRIFFTMKFKQKNFTLTATYYFEWMFNNSK